MLKKFFAALCLVLPPSLAEAKLSVVATIPAFASLAEAVGGADAEAVSLARANQDPHFLDAKPSYVVLLNKADILVHGGLDLEIGWLPALRLQARNAKIMPGASGDVNSAQGLNILELTPTADRAQGDIHPNGNPHTWLDPGNAKLIAANICRAMSAADPARADAYKKRLEGFVGRLNAVIAELAPELAKLDGARVVTYHKSWSYFSAWTGLEVTATVEPKPGIPPSSRHVDDILRLIPERGVKAILVEDYYPHKVPDYLAEKTGSRVLILHNATGTAGIDTYEDLIRHLVTEVARAL